MNHITVTNSEIISNRQGETVRITPCGKNAIRFEGFPNCFIHEEDFTLMPRKCEGEVSENGSSVTMKNGTLSVTMDGCGKLTFSNNGKVILEEKSEFPFNPEFRKYVNRSGNVWSAHDTFEANENEHFYGLGHEPSGKFDLKGCSFDLAQRNAKCTIPFIYSSLGYGFIWNNPAIGSVELSANRTRWSVEATKKIDFVVIGGSPKEIASTLADLTGHAPVMPHWATGFWQSRLRYETQEELLTVARRYKEAGIPLSVIVCDFFHWTEMGDWKFDTEFWPDVRAMTDELHAMGTRLAVSVWPTVSEKSENYCFMRDSNMLMRTSRGLDRVFNFMELSAEIDPTNPAAREFVWKKIKENYIDKGVDAIWLDVAEPEIRPEQFENVIMQMGRGDEYALLYPYYYSKIVGDGFRELGDDAPCTLTRCGYLGSQKFGTLIWSGDIPSTFESLSDQVKAGLNMSVCGIPWWNTDIGGFFGGDTSSEDFRELIVRWFQYGVFSPVMRLHGDRDKHLDNLSDPKMPSGDPNEIWSFGDENYEILKDLIFLRERLRPYIEKNMRTASEKGYPVMRPMFFEYPDDENCFSADEQYMFGDDILFAPIVNKGQTEKEVYLPEGEWISVVDRKEYSKGFVNVKAEINQFIAFVKKGADVLECFE